MARGSLAAVDGQEAFECAGFVEFFEILAVDIGDEGGFEEFFRCGAQVVTDHDLEGVEAGFAGGGEAAAAVDNNVGGVWLEVGFALGVGLDVGVAVHDRDRLHLAVGLEAACQFGEVAEPGTRVVGVGADPVKGQLYWGGDTVRGEAGGCSDGLAACADGTYSPPKRPEPSWSALLMRPPWPSRACRRPAAISARRTARASSLGLLPSVL